MTRRDPLRGAAAGKGAVGGLRWLWRVAVAAGVAVLAGAVAVPVHADTYTDYLAGQLRHDPVYISGFSPMATPADAPEIKRLIARIPLRTYVVADVAAGPDGQMQDSDLAAVLHDQLGGGLFILARTDDSASATGFGTSLPVSDAMTAAGLEGSAPDVTLVQLVQRFVTILLSGKTEQRLAADEQAQLNPGPPAWEVLTAAASGAAVSGGLAVSLLIRHRRRRFAEAGKGLT
jgi:hypothetical protein